MSHGDPRAIKKAIRAALRKVQPGELPPFKKNTRKTVRGRDERAAEWPDFAHRRATLTEERQQVLDRLDELHGELDRHWRRRGINVHRARDAAEAREAILEILQANGARRVMKSKSMLSEEIAVNEALAAAGIEPVETDLGEYIIQLREEPPSHITMPGMHLSREDVGRLFAEELGVEYTDDPPTLTRIARRVLREKFLAAEAGMCGVNFAVASTGHLATVTNEGNGRMVTSLPRTVIALMGRERVTESLDHLAGAWQLLARSATAQRATVYLNLLHGPSPGPNGPDDVHVVVVDNGRTRVEEDPQLREVLRCIRCGACLNVCPVYQQVGGHPYGSVYPGPIGKVLTPALRGLDAAPHHPFASSLCGACEEICPVSIPLPRMLLELRRRRVGDRGALDPERPLWSTFEKTMRSPRRYRAATGAARVARGLLGEGAPVPGWTGVRAAPEVAKIPFRDRVGGESGVYVVEGGRDAEPAAPAPPTPASTQAHTPPVDPDPLPGTRLQRLEAALAEVDASMEVVASDELVEHLGERLRGEGVQRVALGSGELLDRHTIAHALAETGLEVQGTGGPWGKKEEGRHWLRTLATCDVGITCAEGIAAETGTLLETPREVDERAISLLPERHIAIVEEAKVVETVEELVARWRREGEPEGSAVLVTGPSRTADIEKELVLGVHGPLAVHVLVVR